MHQAVGMCVVTWYHAYVTTCSHLSCLYSNGCLDWRYRIHRLDSDPIAIKLGRHGVIRGIRMETGYPVSTRVTHDVDGLPP